MFVSLPTRQKPTLRWATPLLFAAAVAGLPVGQHPARRRTSGRLLLDWGALSGGLSLAGRLAGGAAGRALRCAW